MNTTPTSRKHIRRFGTASFAVGMLLAVTACGSDSSSSSDTSAATTTAAPAGSESTDTASSDTASSDTITSDTVSSDSVTDETVDTLPDFSVPDSVPVPSFDPSGLTPSQIKVMQVTLAGISSVGYEVDTDCLVKVVAQLSESDAAIIAAGLDDDTELSPAAEALSEQAQSCVPDLATPTT